MVDVREVIYSQEMKKETEPEIVLQRYERTKKMERP
jgi:hypothetical protein